MDRPRVKDYGIRLFYFSEAKTCRVQVTEARRESKRCVRRAYVDEITIGIWPKSC